MIIGDKDIISQVKMLYKMNGAEWEKVNLFGISDDSGNNNWNDLLGVVTDDILIMSPGTTKPGQPATDKHQTGADHLAPGYYYHKWALGWHGAKGKYYRHRAFVQGSRPISTIRDTNRNGQIDPSDKLVIDQPWWGINIHTIVGDSAIVGNWSWGCQVWRNHELFGQAVKRAQDSGQELFSYLLMPIKRETKFLYKMGI